MDSRNMNHSNPQLGQVWEYTSVFLTEHHLYILTSIVNNECYGLLLVSTMSTLQYAVGTIMLLNHIAKMNPDHGWSLVI